MPAPINQRSIFFASFMTLIAAGIGFAVRGGILADWGAQFGFTKTELGELFGAGLAGFGVTIIFFSFFADSFGYRALLIGAFVLLVLSAVVTLCATPIFDANGQRRPLLDPVHRHVHLFAGAGVVRGGDQPADRHALPQAEDALPEHPARRLARRAGAGLGRRLPVCHQAPPPSQVRWEILATLYLIPTLYFGIIVLKNRFPVSEAKAAGISLGQMVATLVAPMLLFLFLIHAMVGYVELGTDGWIQNIMKNTIGNKASLLLAYTSILMFILRFFAGPIVHKINPLGLLCVAACCGATGLYLLGTVTLAS